MTLELGGSDPMIICDDADLDAAASAASMGRFYNCGQACLAIKRVYVFESVADEVIEQITAKAKRLKVGRGDIKGSQMGRCTPPPSATRWPDRSPARWSAAASCWPAAGPLRTRSSTTGSSTRPPSSPIRPTTRRWPPRRCSAPRCRSGASPISTRPSTAPTRRRSGWAPRYGRATSHRARQAAERIEAGYTWINSRTKVYDELPFGGWKSSGYGKEHGEEAFDYYTETKSVVFGSQS